MPRTPQPPDSPTLPGGRPRRPADEAALVPPPAGILARGPAHVPPARFPVPFGRYTLESLLGEGGMGVVYLAHDSVLDRKVALKVRKPSARDDDRRRDAFLREARAAATLSHPNICPVYDAGEFEGEGFLTMAFIDGRPLSEARSRVRKPMSARHVAALVRKLAEALAEAHRHKIVHRDLKPSNVMINRRGEPVVMDFGLARLVPESGGGVTQEGDVVGTPAYMPPEQARGELSSLGPAIDVYALGAILYELLAGRAPFEGNSLDVIDAVRDHAPPTPREVNPECDPRLESICLKAMARKAKDRYRAMDDMARDLAGYLRATLADSRHDDPLAVPVAPVTPGRRRLKTAIAVVSVVLLVGLGVFAALLLNPPRGPLGTLPIQFKGDPRRVLDIHVDGRPAERRPGTNHPVMASGPRSLAIVLRGGKVIHKHHHVKPGENPPLVVDLGDEK